MVIIVGAVEVARYIESKSDTPDEKKEILLSYSGKNNEQRELYGTHNIIGNTKEIQRLKHKIHCVSKTDSTVLIYGETGTGKELVAESIHSMGNRKDKKFVSQNCAAIPPNLLEGILFGTEKGSFTGAETRKGLLEVASGGTLFLDEINTMDLNTQSKLLKAIEDKQITRIGGIHPIPVDVRIVSAINVSPKKCLEDKILREDLYYRLRVVELKVPPLRERKEDIPLLIEHFINVYNNKMDKYVTKVSEDVEKYFMNYDWPGNIRELKNAIEGAFNMAITPVIELSDLCMGSNTLRCMGNNSKTNDIEEVSLKELIRNKECEIIANVLNDSESIKEAAEKLNITRQLLNKKMKAYNLNI